MSIKVKFFANLRERMGCAEQEIDAAANVAEVWTKVSEGQTLPANILSAVNMEYVEPDHPVNDGDEVAFFPPVTGG